MPLQSPIAAKPSVRDARLTRSDARADGCIREIAFGRSSVVIARRIAGIAMQVRVPLASYRGVVLSVASSAEGEGEGEGEALHTIELLHRDPDLSVPLFEARDVTKVAGEWNAWAQSLSLPRLLEGAEGQLESFEPAAAISPAPRRRGSAVAKRRTRFSRRRRMGTLQRLAVTYRDEREIVCYE
jgi:hypothetical protein